MKTVTDKDGVIIVCTRDHCTSEERAVIEAALNLRQQQFWLAETTPRSIVAAFDTACDALLAARAKDTNQK